MGRVHAAVGHDRRVRRGRRGRRPARAPARCARSACGSRPRRPPGRRCRTASPSSSPAATRRTTSPPCSRRSPRRTTPTWRSSSPTTGRPTAPPPSRVTCSPGSDPVGRDRVIELAPKPPGWAGKSWACDRGADVATGAMVLFLTRTRSSRPCRAPKARRGAARTGAGLVSGVTAYAMPTFAEQVCVPQLPMTIFGFVPLALLRTSPAVAPRRLAFAYGPLLFVDRAAYLRSGGHAATPGSEREDVELARTFVAVRQPRGRRARRGHRTGPATTRSGRAPWPRGGASSSPSAGARSPCRSRASRARRSRGSSRSSSPSSGWSLGDATLVAGGLVALALLVAFRLVLAIRERMPLRTVLWHPLTVAATTVAQVPSLVDAVRGRPARWRGRTLEGEPS